jgi:hypothetical protein
MVSSGCLVTTLLRGGHAEIQNFGATPGEFFVPAPEAAILPARPILVQGRESMGTNVSTLSARPMNISKGSSIVVSVNSDKTALFVTDSSGNTYTRRSVSEGWIVPCDQEELEYEDTHKNNEAGDPRTVELEPGTAAASIVTPQGGILGDIKIEGTRKNLSVRKGKFTVDILNSISVRLDLRKEYRGSPYKMVGNVPCIPKLDGVQPHDWRYAIELTVDENSCVLAFRQMAVAFRSTSYPGFKILSDTEELVLQAPRKRVELVVSKSVPTATADIEARFLLKDID